MNKLPARRIGVDIYGNGLVEVKSGTSQLVSNDFARNHESSDWSDIKTHRLHIKPEEANDIFQHLVNCGVLDREKHGKKSDKKTFQRFIAVKANICSHTYSENVNIFEEDPDLAENLLDVVREFEGTAIKGNLN
jgi:transcription antitermination factor NusG